MNVRKLILIELMQYTVRQLFLQSMTLLDN